MILMFRGKKDNSDRELVRQVVHTGNCTVYTVQNISLPKVRKVLEGGVIEQCQTQDVKNTELGCCNLGISDNKEKDNKILRQDKLSTPKCTDSEGHFNTIPYRVVQVQQQVEARLDVPGGGDQVHGRAGDVDEQGHHLRGGGDALQVDGGRVEHSAEAGKEVYHQEIYYQARSETNEGGPIVDDTHHQGVGGEGVGGDDRGERVGDGGGAGQASQGQVRWKVPRRRRGVVPDGIVQTRLSNFVVKFPNLGVRGCNSNVGETQTKTASCQPIKHNNL